MMKRVMGLLVACVLAAGCSATTTTPTATAHSTPTAAAATQSLPVQISTPSTKPTATAKPKPYNKFQCGNAGNKVFLVFDDTSRNLREFKALVDEAVRLNIMIGIAPNGNAVKAGRVSVKYARSKGMPVIEHTYSHPLLTKLSYKQIVKQITHPYISSNYVRPPYGAHNATVRKVFKDKGIYNCLWNLDPRDWDGRSPAAAANYIIRNARKGSTVVVHLQHLGKDAKQLERIKKGLAKRGLKLCAATGVPSPKKLPSVLCS